MLIRKATKEDFQKLYEIGKSTIEFQVSEKDIFMDSGEFAYGIEDPYNIFLVAEEDDQIIGFIYTSEIDHDKPLTKRSACLIYLTVLPKFRKRGIAQQLYQESENLLKQRGIKSIYGWANIESDGAILNFLEKQNFSKGHKYIWVDKEL